MVFAIIAVVLVAVVACFGAAAGRCWLNNRRNKAARHRCGESMTVVQHQVFIPGTHAL